MLFVFSTFVFKNILMWYSFALNVLFVMRGEARVIRPLSRWKFMKVSTFTLQINFQKLYVNNIVDASFDVCKHWPIDQSQHFISEISSSKFRKIEHVLNCEIAFHTRNFLAKGTSLHKFRNQF